MPRPTTSRRPRGRPSAGRRPARRSAPRRARRTARHRGRPGGEPPGPPPGTRRAGPGSAGRSPATAAPPRRTSPRAAADAGAATSPRPRRGCAAAPSRRCGRRRPPGRPHPRGGPARPPRAAAAAAPATRRAPPRAPAPGPGPRRGRSRRRRRCRPRAPAGHRRAGRGSPARGRPSMGGAGPAASPGGRTGPARWPARSPSARRSCPPPRGRAGPTGCGPSRRTRPIPHPRPRGRARPGCGRRSRRRSARRQRSSGSRPPAQHRSPRSVRLVEAADNGAVRVRAPQLAGRGWLNTDGPLSLQDLRGRFVLLDFWTFCCVNCLHVLDELRPVEEKYAEELVVVGVHSPKFVHEADPVALTQAVERYALHHPFLDDPELVTWQAYTARAWPTLVLVDPEGYVVAQFAGEGHAHAIDALLAELREEHLARGTLQPGDSPFVPPEPQPGDLRFPAKTVGLPDGRVLVADAGHDEVVELGA